MSHTMRYKHECESEIFSITSPNDSYTYNFTETYTEAPQVRIMDEKEDVSFDINTTRVILTYPHTNGVTDKELVVIYCPPNNY